MGVIQQLGIIIGFHGKKETILDYLDRATFDRSPGVYPVMRPVINTDKHRPTGQDTSPRVVDAAGQKKDSHDLDLSQI